MDDNKGTDTAMIRRWISLVITDSPGWMHWLMVGLMLALVGAVAAFVDLKPHVDEDFFFSTDDPQFQQSKKIDRLFPSESQLIISVASPDISSERYLSRIGRFSKQLKSLDGVTGVRSLTEGPKDFDDA